MASTRLTVAVKETLVSQLIEHAFADRCRKLVAAECSLAQEIYDHTMDTRILRIDGGSGPKMPLRKIVAALPAGWPATSNSFKVELAGQMTKFDQYSGLGGGYPPNNNLVGIKEAPAHREHKWVFQPGFRGNYAINVYDAANELSERAAALGGLRKDLTEEISSMRQSTRATLDAASTVQKLIVIWPEVEAFAAPFLQKETAAAAFLPVVAREHLNSALSLPPGAHEDLLPE